MAWLNLKLHPRRLRTRLLAPIVILVVLGSASLSIIEEFAARKQIEVLVHQRGDNVLEAISKRLQDRQRAKEVFAQLIANQSNLPTLLEQKNEVGLAQKLVPLKVQLKIGFIDVYTKNRQELLNLGATEDPLEAPLVNAALSGLTQSRILVSSKGLLVIASTPIKGAQGIVGALLVGTTLDKEALKSLHERDGVELALFRNGSLVITTCNNLEIVQLLSESQFTGSDLDQLNHQALFRFNFHATAKNLGKGDMLVALIPTQDLVLASQQREIMIWLGTLGLVGAILLVGLLLSRDIAKPLEKMVAVTKELMQGNYSHQVEATQIQELNELGKAINYLALQLEAQITQLKYQAFHDSLTNLPNRALFEEYLHKALANASRRKNLIAVLFLDLDGFKLINDNLGHKVGDKLLVATAECLKTCLRNGDTLARLGGDEFTILLENIFTIKDAAVVAERIAQKLRSPFSIEEHEILITASIGIASNTQDESNRPEDFLRNADLAMYEAKKNGKAHHQIFDLNMRSQAQKQLTLELELRQAIEREEFQVYYQPIVDLQSGKIVEVEALVRWQHPQHGLVSPAEFILLAEKTGLIVQLGRWVLETACQQVKIWQLEYSYNPPLMINVNVSPQQFRQPQIKEEIAEILHKTGLDPRSLQLEITESIVMDNEQTTIATLHDLKDLGIGLAIDDFGTGFSALNYLKQFPVDTLKIDRTFINGLGQNVEDTAIVHAIVAFAKALNLSITAEGIETVEQLIYLQELKCDRAQGYYFAKPLPREALNSLLTSSKECISLA